MCLNSYSFINEQPFSNSISILNFLPIFIFLKCFCRYLKMWKIANLGYGNGRNSKTIYPIYMIFARHMQKTNIYKTMKSIFWFSFQILNNSLIGRFLVTMATVSKIRPHGFVQIFLMYHPPNFESTAKIGFWVTFVTVLTNQRPSLVTTATRLKWQPFSKSTGHGLRGWYHPCGLAFRKVLKFDVENWAVDHWTPPLTKFLVTCKLYFDKLKTKYTMQLIIKIFEA